MQGLWPKIDIAIFDFLQGFLGHSIAFDFLISAAVTNPLVKCVFIGACFVAAWCAAEGDAQYRVRKALTLTIIAGVVGLGLAQVVNSNLAIPRPIVFTAPIHLMDSDGEFHEAQLIETRRPLDEIGIERYETFVAGDFNDNDLKSFPSDHATLYISISVGLLMVHRLLGVLSLIWTILFVILPRMAVGYHWFTDIVAGSIIGAGLTYLLVSMLSERHVWGVEGVLRWSLHQKALSSGLMFAILYDATSQFDNLRLVLKYVGIILKYIVGL